MMDDSPVAITQGVHAGFWARRACAFLIDGILLLLMNIAIGASIALADLPNREDWLWILDGLGIAIPWFYWAGLESSPWQATIGKRLLGLRVIDVHGHPIGFARATGRHVGKCLSALLMAGGEVTFLPLALGNVMSCYFTDRRQALHDFMVGCVILRQQSPGHVLVNGSSSSSRPQPPAPRIVDPWLTLLRFLRQVPAVTAAEVRDMARRNPRQLIPILTQTVGFMAALVGLYQASGVFLFSEWRIERFTNIAGYTDAMASIDASDTTEGRVTLHIACTLQTIVRPSVAVDWGYPLTFEPPPVSNPVWLDVEYTFPPAQVVRGRWIRGSATAVHQNDFQEAARIIREIARADRLIINAISGGRILTASFDLTGSMTAVEAIADADMCRTSLSDLRPRRWRILRWFSNRVRG